VIRRDLRCGTEDRMSGQRASVQSPFGMAKTRMSAAAVRERLYSNPIFQAGLLIQIKADGPALPCDEGL